MSNHSTRVLSTACVYTGRRMSAVNHQPTKSRFCDASVTPAMNRPDLESVVVTPWTVRLADPGSEHDYRVHRFPEDAGAHCC